KTPCLADLRDSGAIEQDADAVLLMHRPDLYESERDELVFVSTQVAKNRHAGMKSFQLGFSLQTGRFIPVQGGFRHDV
ncbi:MAG: DnaB-like helicase C-terminal domain-containing protein, partial [Agathobaculum sp.]|uniref:DnaB-like helicase C-terminal domain-containing protein n=1 Tax=Agathobaculum sp. TaxID=2048138 RepID=UPI003D8A3DBC